MKYLVAGLGNIGSEYQDTRHNIGFIIADALAEKAGASFISDRYAHVAEMKFKGRTLIIIKPSTYMNLSGKAINYWMQAEKIPIENIFVVTDDIALPFGAIRIRGKGSDGGHNGLTNIIETLNTSNFARLRFGIGSDFNKGGQVNYVLGEWSDDEKKFLPEHMVKCIDAIKSFTASGLAQTMNQYNNK